MESIKGLSELIAVVLIIAFVVAVAAIVATFSTGFTRGQITKVQREGGETVDCTSAAVEIVEDSVSKSGSTLYVTVKNTGRLDLGDVDIVFRNTSGSAFETYESNTSMASGTIRTIQITGFINPVDRVIATTDCPGITDTVNNVSGTFKRAT